jgi:cytochrome bd-type quinol oxidase subunit 2
MSNDWWLFVMAVVVVIGLGLFASFITTAVGLTRPTCCSSHAAAAGAICPLLPTIWPLLLLLLWNGSCVTVAVPAAPSCTYTLLWMLPGHLMATA